MLSRRLGASCRVLCTLLVAGGLLAGCGVVARQALQPSSPSAQPSPQPGEAGRHGKLTAQELQWAKTAWRYVENNTDADSGLVNGMDRHPVFTMWNAGDALAAVVSAHELGVIDAREFDARISRLLGFLATMDLAGGGLPNKAYSTAGGKMVNFENRSEDIGWSATDLGRLLLWLKIVGQRHPQFQEYADKAVLRWTFCDVIDDCGALSGLARSKGQVYRYPEGRLGYEQLAAAGFAAWGFETRASAALPRTQAINIYGMPLLRDARDERATGVQAPVLTMPHVLMGMELGWHQAEGGPALRDVANQVYKVQEERWRRERQFTARSDYQMREAPYTVLDSVFAAGYAWNTIAPDGKEHEKLALVSTRAAFGLWALWPGDYADRLIEAVRWLYDPDRGWYEGRLEAGGAPQTNITLSTNAALLETLLFKAKGTLFSGQARPGYFQRQAGDPFLRLNRCWPAERPACTAPRQ